MRIVNGVPIDPPLPADFDNTPNEDRDFEQVEEWWGRPFIVTDTRPEESYDDYVARIQGYGMAVDHSREEWDASEAEGRKRWHAAFPSGTRFVVRCLDGGAWDRSTGWGIFGSLEDAIECAQSGPRWR